MSRRWSGHCLTYGGSILAQIPSRSSDRTSLPRARVIQAYYCSMRLKYWTSPRAVGPIANPRTGSPQQVAVGAATRDFSNLVGRQAINRARVRRPRRCLRIWGKGQSQSVLQYAAADGCLGDAVSLDCRLFVESKIGNQRPEGKTAVEAKNIDAAEEDRLLESSASVEFYFSFNH